MFLAPLSYRWVMVAQALVGFVAGAWLLAVAVVALARASASMIASTGDAAPTESREGPESLQQRGAPLSEAPPAPQEEDTVPSIDAMSTDILLLNVLVTQGGVILLVAAGAVLASVPMAALGVPSSLLDVGMLSLGLAVGLGLYLLNEILSVFARRFGSVPEDFLRSALTPDTTEGWILLVSVILPLVALGEELLFRAALLGATPLVSGVPTLGILLISSLLFGLAHAVQGRAGIGVASVLGLGLGSAYLVTGNLFVVVLAHYIVNLLEFVVHELLGWGSS